MLEDNSSPVFSNEKTASRKRLLIFSDWFSPAYKAGGPIRSISNLAELLQTKLDIWIFTSNQDHQASEPLETISSDQWVKFQGRIKVFYSSSRKQSFGFIKKVIGEINPHFVYLNSMFSLKFSLFPLLVIQRRKKIPEKVILAPRGMLHAGAIQYKRQKKQWYLFFTKHLGLFKKIIFHATDQQEKKDILKYFGSKSKTVIIPNISKLKQNQLSSIPKNPGQLKSIFISRIHPKKNLLFFLQLLSKVPSQFKVNLTIAGNIEDDNYWQKCLQQMTKLPINIKANYVGPLPHDQIDHFLENAHIFVLPTFGENFGHAIFESLSVGRPVLISNLTPWQNLSEKKIGWDLPLDNEEIFMKCLLDAIQMDQTTYDLWSGSAWEFAYNYIQNSKVSQQYLELFS